MTGRRKKYGFGIIGCGMIADLHVNAIEDLSERAKLIGIADTVRDSAERLSLRHGGLEIFDSVDALLADKRVDIVCICTPSGYHADMILRASEAGKNIIVEKPMAITAEQLDAVEETCKRNKTVLSVISQLRFARDINRAKFAVETGELGKLCTADMYMKYFRSQEYYDSGAWRGTKRLDGGGALMNQGIHGVDLLQYLAGDVHAVYGVSRTRVRRIEVEDTLCATLEFTSGAIGVLQATTSVYPGYPRRIELNGEKGSLTVEETALTRMDISGNAVEDLTLNPVAFSGSSTAMNISGDYHTAQIADVIEAIAEKRRPLVDINEGRKAVDIVLAIYRSVEEGRRVKIEEMHTNASK